MSNQEKFAFVLDTSAYIGILNGDHQIARYLESADMMLVPVIVIGELYFGYHRGSRYYENVQLLQRFLENDRVVVVPIDEAISERYGSLKNAQYKTGNILAENDLWIAATSLQLELPLLTFDSDFNRVVDDAFELLPV